VAAGTVHYCLYKGEWRKEEARRQAPSASLVVPIESHLTGAGLGHVSEIFEGDAPHHPCGCIAQAWSVAEILRVYSEELRACGRTHGHAFIQPKVKTGQRAHNHSRCNRSQGDPRIAPRGLLDCQVIFRGARAPGRHLLQRASGLSITRFVKSGGLHCYQFPFSFLSPEHC
jgi:Amylo-alpha-1,6-glucosidase